MYHRPIYELINSTSYRPARPIGTFYVGELASDQDPLERLHRREQTGGEELPTRFLINLIGRREPEQKVQGVDRKSTSPTSVRSASWTGPPTGSLSSTSRRVASAIFPTSTVSRLSATAPSSRAYSRQYRSKATSSSWTNRTAS